MKLKYKRIVLLTTTFTMLIGMVIFSIVSPKGKSADSSHTEEAQTDSTVQGQKEDREESDLLEENQMVVDGQEIVLEKSVDEALNQLIADYFDACVSCDIEKLETLVSDVSILDEDELKIKYGLVEEIKNIQCYVVKGPSEGKYLVYVYNEVKFKDIDTMAPGLSRLTVVNTADDNYVIFFGADEEVERFAELTDSSAPVQEMVQKVSTRMEEALSKDADLKALNEKMTGAEQNE